MEDLSCNIKKILTSNLFEISARCWKQIKTAFRLEEEEDSPLENRSVTRHIETVVRNLLAYFNYVDKVDDEDFWDRPHFEARDYLNRDTRVSKLHLYYES